MYKKKRLLMKDKEIMDKDKEFFIQGYARVPLVLVEGKGTILKDINGKEYIDCFAGIAVSNVGHAHERLVRVANEQMSKLIHTSGRFFNIPQTLLVEKLAEITPDKLKHTYLCNSGTEAVENAVKLVKKYAFSRGKLGAALIAIECSFHGRLGYSLSLTGQAKYKKGFGTYANAPGVVHVPVPYSYRSKFTEEECGIESALAVEKTIDRQTAGDVAAFIMEPILGEGGIIVPPDTYYETLTKILKERDIPLIIDEVQSGFGRTGRWFAIEHWNLKPDLITMAKGMGGGMPIGAVIATSEIANSVESGDFFSTYGGNPVCSSVAMENIAILKDEKLIENSEKIGRIFFKGLNDLQEKYPIIGDIRGKGLMIGIELVKDPKKKTPASDEAKKLVNYFMDKGVIIGLGGIHVNVLRLQPPLCITEEQAIIVLEKFNQGLKNL
ncbi:MAG: aspartate aminotransferase family protein [Candidatus Heimdallarchaeota archaeon]|nr:MAG: aspartate aminotransferase family protein [Candidatus Heimdallarchaeota archaeon]